MTSDIFTSKTVEYRSDLAAISWPDDAVFIIDKALPETLLDILPDERIYITAGEEVKSLASIDDLAAEVLKIRSSRPLTLVAVGGGSVGDAVGFLASILWRGVSLWHVPTTLLAMVDSAHGGKTAVNLTGQKNQLGTFYVADRVLLSENFLQTLPLVLREEGMVELLKALWLGAPDALQRFDAPEIYDQILTGNIQESREMWRELLKESISVKYEVVAQDPREESGLRRILNLGHTAGHGLEALYGLPHGRAIAWGMAACAVLSQEFANLSAEDARRLFCHLDPLLTPLPEFPDELDRRLFIEHLQKDKKQLNGKLISILLEAPGVPLQTTDIEPAQWWEATRRAFDLWQSGSLTLSTPSPPAVPSIPQDRSITLPPDKSQANRAAIIAHLRSGSTILEMPPSTPPTDIVDLRLALRRLSTTPDTAPATIFAGNGGTVGRFLLALAATRPATTEIILSPGLMSRPHDAIIDALRQEGATIEANESGFTIEGWTHFPSAFSVDGRTSSQFASALALLSATGNEFDLHIDGQLVSRPYFDLTLNLLRRSGVVVDETFTDPGQTIHFSPTSRLQDSLLLDIPQDTSSGVVWHALSALFDSLDAPPPADAEHPDSRFPSIVSELLATNTPLEVNLTNAPDLAPVLAALASQLPAELIVIGAAHLRHKESDRISELTQSFLEVGITIEPRPDGFRIPPGIQRATMGSVFDPRGDHRLAMAAFVVSSLSGGLQVRDVQCVTKSYPDLWRHARLVGFRITGDNYWPDSGNR